MILLADESFKEQAAQRVFGNPNPYSIRTASLFSAYGGTGLADFWVQWEHGAPVSFLAKTGGSMILDLSDRSDKEEIAQFLAAAAGDALYDGRFSVRPRRWQTAAGATMRYTGLNTLKPQSAAVTGAPDLYALHNLLLRCGSNGFFVPSFEDFYPDLSHKLRHGCAHAVGVLHGGRLIAAALCLFRFENCAVVGSVACDPLFRGQGYGSSAVLALLELLKKDGVQEIFLHRAQDKQETFYNKLGFENCGAWKQCGRSLSCRKEYL